MALIDDSPRMATATALAETVCCLIPHKVFQEKMADADPFLRALLRIFVVSIRSISPPDQKIGSVEKTPKATPEEKMIE